MVTPMSTIRILIVDNMSETREQMLNMLFNEADIEVVGLATNGTEAIHLSEQQTPNIVLMNMDIPEMDGLAACDQITSLETRPNVILMSVRGTPDDLRQSMLVGAKEFLVIPFSTEELLKSIRRVANPGVVERPATAIVSLKQSAVKLFILSDTATELQEALASEPDIEIVGTLANDTDGRAQVIEASPDVLIIEGTLALDGLITSQLIREKQPIATILIVGNQTEADYLQQSQFATTVTLLARPFADEVLGETVRAVSDIF